MFSVLLLALLPLTATAAPCSGTALHACPKCGVGAIAITYNPKKPCNCNGIPGYFGKMCGETGNPTYPVCCSTDGKKATEVNCACGTSNCGKDQYCTAESATDADAKCVYNTCASTDGSKAYTGTNQCQCGTTSCRTGEKCTAKSATDADAKCEYPIIPCKTIDGGSTGNTMGCECGTTVCSADDGKCTAANNTCVVPEQPEIFACDEGKEVTKACKCGSRLPAIGQICKSGTVTWPECVYTNAVAKYGQYCMCAYGAAGDQGHMCSYGQKCLHGGPNLNSCECEASDSVLCVEQVPPSDKCPHDDCAGHTTIGAKGYPINSCVKYNPGRSLKYIIKDGKYGVNYFTGENCETTDSSMKSRETMTPGGCKGDSYTDLTLTPNANSGTALKTMPIVLMVSILASMFL